MKRDLESIRRLLLKTEDSTEAFRCESAEEIYNAVLLSDAGNATFRGCHPPLRWCGVFAVPTGCALWHKLVWVLAWARALPGAWRWDEANSKRVHATPWGLIGKQSSPSEKHRFLEAIAKGHLEQAQNLREWMHEDGTIKTLESLPEPLTAARLAYQCGVSRRTFYRWFPGWRRAVQKLVAAKLRKKLFDEEGGIVAGDEGVDFDGMDARNGWRD
jgi:hypothetical protein